MGEDFVVLDHSIIRAGKATFDFWVDDVKVLESRITSSIFFMLPRPMRHLSPVSRVWKQSVINSYIVHSKLFLFQFLSTIPHPRLTAFHSVQRRSSLLIAR